MDKRKTDVFFARLFMAASLVSVLALGAILLFVLAQGSAPFLLPTAPDIRIVTEGVAEITVNGRVYPSHTGFIPVPAGASAVSIAFSGKGGPRALSFTCAPGEAPVFTGYEGGKLTNPEAFVYTLSYSGAAAGLEQKVHVIMPEPAYRIGAFLFGLDWRPAYNKVYGILPMIAGTVLVSLGAILLGMPPAVLCGLFLAEFLSEKAAAVMRSGVEILAGIPSVVYGFFGLMVIVPGVKQIFQAPSGNGMVSAMLVLAMMLLPTVIVITETSLRAVPRPYREASLALGATKMQTAWHVVLPHAGSGVFTGVVLGISRAVGETMAVILVAGNSSQLPRSPLDSVRTLTATIALEMGYAQGRHSEMLFSIGITLFALILGLNSLILWMRRSAEA
ncbi:MAG: phosphate ABC transporter permease subunit PstC [Spirochaetaceae bacterium]|jgi:phosphate transport system permease protein|nr:phosphate ABC transporter permease subunit PstC [Spirochaetaceae bacterium]